MPMYDTKASADAYAKELATEKELTEAKEERPRIIISDELIGALRAAGVVAAGQRVRRVVIDLQVRTPPIVHVERFGDERMLEVVRALEGVRVCIVEASDDRAEDLPEEPQP